MNYERVVRRFPRFKLWLSSLFSHSGFVSHPLYRYLERRIIQWKSILYERRPPWQVHIENTNYCNARCIMCPNPTMKREKAFMSDSLYENAVQEIVALGTRRMNLQSIGEPFLDKKFVTRLRFAKDAGLEVATSSNGSILTEELARALIESGLDELNISVDGYRSKTFDAIRHGLHYEQVLDNVERFLRIKKQLRAKRPFVFLRMTLIQENSEECEPFIQLWSRKADGAFISMAHDWAGGVSPRFRGRFHGLEDPTPPCKLLWREVMILHDGSVSSCCHDFEGTNILGNIRRESLRDIWYGQAMRKIRQTHLEGALDAYPTCDRCRIRTIWWV